MYYIPWLNGFDGLVVYTVNGGESLRYVYHGGPLFQIGISSESLCIRSISCHMCMASLDLMWAGCPCALCYVAVLPITLYQSGPVYHYLVVCSVVRGLRSFDLIVAQSKHLWYSFTAACTLPLQNMYMKCVSQYSAWENTKVLLRQLTINCSMQLSSMKLQNEFASPGCWLKDGPVQCMDIVSH